MKIDVFGAIFLDRYIYEEEDSTQVVESIGGSGLSIALGLHLLGHDVRFYGNIGQDERKDKILNELENNCFPIEGISIKSGVTGLFTAKNDKLESVERGVNAEELTIDMELLSGECAVITTELNKISLQRILSLSWEKIFLDIGPRPHMLDDIILPENIIKIGNSKENEKSSCHIVKLGPYGAKWGNTVVGGSNESLPYTIGAGDLFDTILIDSTLRDKDKRKALELAVKYAEESCKMQGGFKFEKLKDKMDLKSS
ncbi:PfkB family carbohydrate kinase [Wukongibacter baidiensis]|uniref:PfkB family carbohydrate kinase n=1 Tax=Wukongibacter baidiensis TaxID=1723361 RepID=UPI003D7F5F43